MVQVTDVTRCMCRVPNKTAALIAVLTFRPRGQHTKMGSMQLDVRLTLQ